MGQRNGLSELDIKEINIMYIDAKTKPESGIFKMKRMK